MRLYYQIVVLSLGCALVAGLAVGCASGKSANASRSDGVSGPRVPMRPARRPGNVVVEEPSVDWSYGMYQWPDPWVPLVLYNRSGLIFFNAKGEVYRTFAWQQDEQGRGSAFWALDLQGDGLPAIVAAGEPTLFLRSNADVWSVQPRGCPVMVGVEKTSGRRLLKCQDASKADDVPVRPLENYATKLQGAYAVDENFFFDFSGDGQTYEFAKLHDGGLSIVSRTEGKVAEIATKTPVESMMAVDLDGDGAEELVVLTGDEVLIMRGERPHLLRWPTDTRRYARTVVTEATEVVGSLLARESVSKLLVGLGACFEDELGLLYDKPDAVVQVSLSAVEEKSEVKNQVEYTVTRGYLYDEQLACIGRTLNEYKMPLAGDRTQNQLKFRVRINWRDALAAEVAVDRAADELLAARRAAESVELRGKREKHAMEQVECADLVLNEGGRGLIEDPEELAHLVEALGGQEDSEDQHPAFGRPAADGGALVPPLDFVRASMRCAPDFDGDGMGERLVLFEWSSTLDSAEMCNSDVEIDDVPCYPHRLHVLFSPAADWKVLAVIADHFIGYMHDQFTLFGADYQYLLDGRAAMRVTFTNRDARTGCFFGSSALMTYDDGQFVRAPGTQRQLTPCFPDMDQTLVEAPEDLRCPGVHQLENIEGYKRAGFAEIYDHDRGVAFRCFQLFRSRVHESTDSEN